jgi:hypothetical protein
LSGLQGRGSLFDLRLGDTDLCLRGVDSGLRSLQLTFGVVHGLLGDEPIIKQRRHAGVICLSDQQLRLGLVHVGSSAEQVGVGLAACGNCAQDLCIQLGVLHHGDDLACADHVARPDRHSVQVAGDFGKQRGLPQRDHRRRKRQGGGEIHRHELADGNHRR